MRLVYPGLPWSNVGNPPTFGPTSLFYWTAHLERLTEKQRVRGVPTFDLGRPTSSNFLQKKVGLPWSTLLLQKPLPEHIAKVGVGEIPTKDQPLQNFTKL